MAALGRRHHEGGLAVRHGSGGGNGGDNMIMCSGSSGGNVRVVGVRSGSGSSGGGGTDACDGGGMDVCGGGGDGSWTPSQPFMSSHSRGTRLLFFSQMMVRVCWGGGGVPSPLIEPKMGREGKGPT